MSFFRINLLATVFTLLAVAGYAQNRPVGTWRSLLPYNNAVGVASDGNEMFAICNQAFFTTQATNAYNTITTYSKVEGMSDIGMQCVGYDNSTETLVLVYVDGNIDLFKENENTFYNVPDLLVKQISGSKTVNGIFVQNGYAYLSTSIGVLVLNLKTHNFDETYQFNVNGQSATVYGFTASGIYYYAATAAGVYRAAQTDPQLQNFQEWQIVDSSAYSYIASVNNTVYMSTDKKVNALVHDSVKTAYICRDTNHAYIEHIDSSQNGLLICSFYSTVFRGSVITLDSAFQVADSFVAGDPLQAITLPSGRTWVADNYYGLAQRVPGTLNEQFFVPPGPTGAYSFDIYAYNKDVWVAHGGYGQNLYALPSYDGVSHFSNEQWSHYLRFQYAPFDTVDAFVTITKDQTNGIVYMGSFLEGLFTLHPDGDYSLLNVSVFDSSALNFNDNQRQVISTGLDQSDNLWVTTVGSYDQLYVKTPDSNWYKFHIPNASSGPLVIDNYGQVWFSSITNTGGGLVVYNDNNTPADASDDTYYHLYTGVGSGNLPSNNVLSLAKDLNNSIWVGTDNGIGIVSNCSFSSGAPSCDAQIPIVQYDLFAGYLFAGYSVTTIAVDGANRKWIGTDNGVWLLSPNANAIVYAFNTSNSPLPSNTIQKISIDPVTGDVYIGTDAGLVSFHGTATGVDSSNSNELIFPNPVPSGYTGTIAIKGLVANADVRITDIDGQLVYKTTALGGQAVWNGMDYTGHRPQSGVYLVFVSSSDGSQKWTGKIVFVQ